MNAIHLFAGAGGSLLLGDILGWTHIAASETDPWCRAVLAHRYPNLEVEGDIRQTNWSRYAGRCDLVAAGWPCQPVSLAGKRRGADDPRDGWIWLADALGDLRPRVAFLENSTAVLSHDRGGYWARCLGDLATIGYDARWICLRASEAGAPHRRDRMWCICWRVADTEGTGRGREGSPGGASNGEAIEPQRRPGSDMAYSNGADLRHQPGRLGGESRAPEAEPGGRGEELADPYERGRDSRAFRDGGDAHQGRPRSATAGRRELAGTHRERQHRRSLLGGQDAHESPGFTGAEGIALAALGGGAARLAPGLPWPALDNRWPGPRGAAQEAWEPPRTCGALRGRSHQLRALGNGWCIPQALMAWRMLTGDAND